MANTYTELLGSTAEAAMAFSNMWNTPAATVPGAASSAIVNGAQRMLIRMHAPVKVTGIVDPPTDAAMIKLFGPAWKTDFRWVELLQGIYDNINAGRSPWKNEGGFGLEMVLEPKVQGVPVIPVVAGLGLLWFFFGRKKSRR